MVGSQKCVVVISINGLSFSYKFGPITAIPETPSHRWVWLFVALCLAIPVVTLGGAIPGAIGAGGAYLCYGIARSENDQSTQTRVGLCVMITFASWGLLLAFIAVLARAR